MRPVSNWLIEHVDPQPGQTLLELTAGPGETGFLAAPRLGSGGRLISSDFVPAMVEAAQRGAARRGLDNVDCRVIDATQIDLPDDSVDGVLSRFGLMLIPQQELAMREIRRVLRPGGRCAFATWGPLDRNPWIMLIVTALLQNGHAPPSDAFAPGGMFSLSTSETASALAASGGFTEVIVDELTGIMRFENPDDYWAYNTSLAGPIAELVGSLTDEQVRAVRDAVGPALAGFERDGGLELSWHAVVTSVA
ncbi:hypothetical protein AU188_22715 [Mycobacterium sp. IS-3022]|nr:hypothetical protein AU188_20975 [Mycobacterium sp. IS-3022]KUH97486.1 hypothetical protein AU188_22715 [Mycobacterium sp. IS-3022]